MVAMYFLYWSNAVDSYYNPWVEYLDVNDFPSRYSLARDSCYLFLFVVLAKLEAVILNFRCFFHSSEFDCPLVACSILFNSSTVTVISCNNVCSSAVMSVGPWKLSLTFKGSLGNWSMVISLLVCSLLLTESTSQQTLKLSYVKDNG